MREINLPITQTVSATIDLETINESAVVDLGNGRQGVHIGSMIDEDISKSMEVARGNGGKILYATTSIEQGVESILLRYFMGDFVGLDKRRDLFEREILQSSALSYSSKKELLSKIVNEHDLLQGKEKNKLQGQLKKIMVWRNAFAHGKVLHDTSKGCFIRYYSGGIVEETLDDNFWDELESVFQGCTDLLKKAKNNVEKI